MPILSRRFGQYQQVNPELLDLFYDYRMRNPRGGGRCTRLPTTCTRKFATPLSRS
ncbi:MAG: hypothetical protein M5U09_01200 [Gammaproteobacteria bacterium]|nr:hypothetical protein [Gammaproteobacteria bacterium]